MRAVRAVSLGVAAVACLLLLALWAGPGLLDWNRYRESIAALAASGIGRPVRIGGSVTLHLLPQPILTAAGIEVDDAGDGVALTAQELRLRVGLGSLLAGRVDARELVLRGADLHLPWPLPGGLNQRPPAWLTGLQARLEDSRLEVGRLALTGIDAAISADPDTGTLSTAGLAQVGGRPWRFTARLGRPGRDGAAGLDASLDGQGPLRDTGGTFSGQLASDGALLGRLAGRGPDLSQVLPGPTVPWRGDGRLSATAGLAVADGLVLEIGGSPAHGAVALRLLPEARLDVALSVGRLDLDAWLPVLSGGSAAVGGWTVPTGIDLSAEAATLAGGTLRRLRGSFDLDETGVVLRDGTAMLPGDAQLGLSGRLSDRGHAPRFDGSAQLSAPDLRATLRWLEPLAPRLIAPLPPGTLRTADVKGNAVLASGHAALSGIEGTLDGSLVTGGLSVQTGARPMVGADLHLERLVLDPWIPDLPALAVPAGWHDALARAMAFDAEIKVQARQALLRGVAAGPFLLDVRAEAGGVTLRRLEATAMGLHASGSGMAGEGGRITDGRLELLTQDAAQLRDMLPPGIPPGVVSGPATALALVSGTPEALAVKLSVDLAGLRLEMQPVLNLPARRLAGPVMLHHPGAPRLLVALGLPGIAGWLGDGSFSLLGRATAMPGQAELEGFDVAAGGLRAKGTLGFEGGVLSGQVAAETLPLPWPSLRSRAPLPLAGLRGWDAAVRLDVAQAVTGPGLVLEGVSADLTLRNGVLQAQRLGARLGGGTVSGTAMLDAAADPPRLGVQAKAAGVAVPGLALDTSLGLVAGPMDAEISLSATGHSPVALVATLAGDGSIIAVDGTATGFDLPRAVAALAGTSSERLAAEARAALLDGSTPFTRLTLPFKVQRGVLLPDGHLVGAQGEAALTGSIDLAGASADLRLVLRPAAPAPPDIAVRLTGPLDRLVHTPELAGLARWLAEQAAPPP